MALAVAEGATFVARSFALDINQLSDLVMAALSHRGYALIDVMQPCVSFNKGMDYDWYRSRVYKVEEEGHDASDRMAAMARAFEYPGPTGRIPTGIIYRREDVPSYEEQVAAISQQALVAQPLHARPVEAYRALVEAFV